MLVVLGSLVGAVNSNLLFCSAAGLAVGLAAGPVVSCSACLCCWLSACSLCLVVVGLLLSCSLFIFQEFTSADFSIWV